MDTIDTKQRERAREHIRSEASEAFYAADSVLRRKFYLDNDTPPQNAKEMIARITAGKYVLDPHLDDEDHELRYVGYPTLGIAWRDPANVADKDGYAAALEALHAQLTTVKDATIVLEPAVALDALNGFRAYCQSL